jgi:hypothetical protein
VIKSARRKNKGVVSISATEEIRALHRIVGILAMAAADIDPKFRPNFLGGLAAFAKQSTELGRLNEAEILVDFATRFAEVTDKTNPN